jgi:hypothetical protein
VTKGVKRTFTAVARPGCLLIGAACLSVAPPARLRAQARPSIDAVLASLAGYIEAYEQQFSAVVSAESYTLTVSKPVPVSAFAVSTVGRARRELKSDLIVIGLGNGNWMQFRDVYDVDSKPVRDHDDRLAQLFLRPTTDLMSRARQIADESARYNLGITRNINVPTMALGYLRRANQPRSRFSLGGTETVHGVSTLVLEFRETARPWMITSAQGGVPAAGRVWIEPATGRVRRTELQVALGTAPTRLDGRITVEYGPEPGASLLVPVSMDESYTFQSGEIDRGHATYSNFRRFKVDTRIIKAH